MKAAFRKKAAFSVFLPMQPVISATVWKEKVSAHRKRAERWTLPAKARHASREPHPIQDFLFTYYPFSFAKLETWHPPFGTFIERFAETEEFYAQAPYRHGEQRIFSCPSRLSEKALARLHWMRHLLDQTHSRQAIFSCHGLHEWAMVYRGKAVRHESSTPFRLGQAEIDRVVETRPITCSHFDAFRFFHKDALPLNRLQPSLLERPEFEQPGCIHANMDLYKWASKAMPWVGSDLLLDTFELALELREVDMRASPYDVSKYGLEPIPIESAQGRRDYEILQRQLADRARPLRLRLIEALDRALSVDLAASDSCHSREAGLRPKA